MPINLFVQRLVLLSTIFVAIIIVYIPGSSQPNQTLKPIDFSIYPVGPLVDGPGIYRYRPEIGSNFSIQTLDNLSETHHLHVEFNSPPEYTGIGIAMMTAVPSTSSLHLRFRCSGFYSHIQMDITDSSQVSNGDEKGETYYYNLLPTPDKWQDIYIPLEKFKINPVQFSNAKQDGIFDTGAISAVSFTIPTGSQMDLDVQTIEFVWGRALQSHTIPLFLIFILGIYLLSRSTHFFFFKYNPIRNNPYATANQLVFLLTTASYLVGMWELTGEIAPTIKILYFAFFSFVFIEEMSDYSFAKNSIYCLRFALTIFALSFFGMSLPVFPGLLLSFVAYIPAVFYPTIILISIVFALEIFDIQMSLFLGRESYYRNADIPYEFLLVFIQIIIAALIREYIHHQDTRKESQKTASFYEGLFEQTSDGIYTVDIHNRLQSINRGFVELVGLSKQQLQSKNLLELIAPNHQVLLMSKRQLLHPGESLTLEIHFLHPDGKLRTVLLREQGLFEDQNQIGYQGLATNITERFEAEEKLRLRETLYRSAIEIAGAVPYYQNYLTESYEFVGDNIEKLTGYTPEEFIPEVWSSMVKVSHLVGELKGLPVKEASQKVRSRKDLNWVCEYLIATRSGEEKWVFNVAIQVHDSEDRTVGSLGILKDITESKQLEEALRRESLTFQYIYDGLILFDHSGRILDWNAAAVKMFGYTKEEAQSLNAAGLYKDAGGFHLGHALESVSQKGSWCGVVTFLNKSGQEGICETVIAPLCDQKNEAIALFSINHDITERCRAEQERITLEEKLQQSQKMEALGRLAGGIAHDFNNLLTAIRGYSDLLGMKLGEFPDLIKDLEQIRKASERASDLTRQLLVFSRRQIISPIVLNLNDRVREMEKMLRPMIGEDIEFITHLWAEETYIKSDPGQIEMVLMNLVVNARDAMPTGGKLTLETSSVVIEDALSDPALDIFPGRYVLLTIRDTGIGMNDDILPHIFEPFFTTKETGKGTGLGLSTVYGIVSQCEGRIVVDSHLGHGTTFHIYLPCVEAAVNQSVPLPVGEENNNGAESILLVEDEISVRTLVRKILESRGYRVLEAENPQNAIEICSDNTKLDLLLTDVVMPQMSGRVLSERLHELHPDLKVLFMSGYTDDTILKHGISGKGIPFLQKPFTANTLLEKIRHILDR